MTIKIVVKNENQNANSSGETFTLEDLLISIGSGNEATLQLVGDKIASEQAVIVNENERTLLVNQVKGTILNDQEIEQGFSHRLQTGDRIRIGSYHLNIELNRKSFAERAQENISENSLAETASSNNGQVYSPSFDEDFFPETPTAITNKLEAETFADILSSLRKDEDQFYFQLTESNGARRRILVESDETTLGWDTANNFFSTDKESNLDQPHAVIRKDWNGVTIYPSGNEAILLNDALLEASSRLRNNDKLIFSRRLNEAGTQSVTLVFCEPAALIELNAILPQQLVSSALETNNSGEITVNPGFREQLPPENQQTAVAETQAPPAKKRSPYYFGYFMLAEIIIMIIATILTAVLTFILLEFA